MKTFLSLLFAGVLVCALSVACDKERQEPKLSDAYYWLWDEKIPLERIEEKYFVMFLEENKGKFKDELAKAGAEISNVETGTSYYVSKEFGDYSTATVEGNYEKVKGALSLTIYWGHYYNTEEYSDVWANCTVSVKLKSKADYPLLEKMASKNGIKIVGYDDFIDAYQLACTNDSKGNSVEMGNLFHETGLFEYACANFAGMGSIN